MNITFWILVILVCIGIWFVLAFTFKPIGKLFYKIGKDAMEELKSNQEEEDDDGE